MTHSHDILNPSIALAATELAAAGHHTEALSLLTQLSARSVEHELLRGRCLAQQGNFSEAIRAFEAVLAISPEHAEAKRALARARDCQSEGSSARRGLSVGVAVAMLAVVFGGLGAAIGHLAASSDSTAQRSDAALSSANQQLVAHIAQEMSAAVEARLTALRTEPPSAPSQVENQQAERDKTMLERLDVLKKKLDKNRQLLYRSMQICSDPGATAVPSAQRPTPAKPKPGARLP